MREEKEDEEGKGDEEGEGGEGGRRMSERGE